jgi:hypothetical protein
MSSSDYALSHSDFVSTVAVYMSRSIQSHILCNAYHYVAFPSIKYIARTFSLAVLSVCGT